MTDARQSGPVIATDEETLAHLRRREAELLARLDEIREMIRLLTEGK